MSLKKLFTRCLIGLGVICIAAVTAGSAYIAWLPSESLPLPDRMVAYDHHPIREEHISADFNIINDHFQTQRFRSFCGVASSVIAINSLNRTDIEQLDYFGKKLSPSFLSTYFGGMTLEQFSDGLNAHGLTTETYFASSISLEEFKKELIENLSNENDLLVANYSRGQLDQVGTGHISPIGAYDPSLDAVLVMDVASYKYPFSWVKLDEFFASMRTIDSTSGKDRGYVVVGLRK